MKKNAVAVALIALSIPMFAGTALAWEHRHDAGPNAASGHAGSGMMSGRMMGGMCPMMAMAKHTEGTLAFLKAELAVTPSESAAWEGFAAAYREAHGGGMESHRGGMMDHGGMMGHADDDDAATPALPERIDQHLKMMEGHLQNLQRLQAPIESLYGALDSDQKYTADELMPMFVICPMM